MAARKLAILGCGKIGESLLAGLLSAGWREPRHVVVTGRRDDRMRELAERYGVRGTLSNAEAVSGAGLVVIAVKPQDFDVLLGEIGGILTPQQTSISRWPRKSCRMSAPSRACRSSTWMPSRLCPVRGRPTSRCSPRR